MMEYFFVFVDGEALHLLIFNQSILWKSKVQTVSGAYGISESKEFVFGDKIIGITTRKQS
jgi:hypothetical protein